MDRFFWVRPAMRLIGVLLIGLALPSTVHSLVNFVDRIVSSDDWRWDRQNLFAWLAWGLSVGLQFLLGMYLLFGGRSVLRWCLRGVDSCCLRCGYELEGVRGDKCPECGLEIPTRLRSNSAPAS